MPLVPSEKAHSRCGVGKPEVAFQKDVNVSVYRVENYGKAEAWLGQFAQAK